MNPYAVRMHSAPIEDAFIYRTSLYCWTFDGSLRIYSIDDIEAAIVQADPDHGDYINYGLFHSRGIGASAAQLNAWWSTNGHPRSAGPVDIDAESIPYVTSRVAFEADALLDLLIFYDTMFLATSNGLFSISDLEPMGSSEPLRTVRHLSDACYAASAGLGAVGASCGEEGLQLLLGVNVRVEEVKPRLAAERSLRSEIGYGSVVNHRSRADFEFIDGVTEDTSRGAILRDFRQARVSVQPRAEHHLREMDDADLVVWDHSRLVVFDNHQVSSVSVLVHDRERSLNKVSRLGDYDERFGRVLSATKVDRMFAVEGENASDS